jgi:hypothetical protein
MVKVVTAQSRPTAARRLGLALLVVALGAVGLGAAGLLSASGAELPAATPQADCGPGSRPESGIQGRVPAADYASGRAARGYRCNTRQVAHHGQTGGFKVLRYTDRRGHTCAYYDSTRVFPTDVPFQGAEGLGVVVLDMDDPAHPQQTANLTSLAMLSPHESLLLHQGRGLLAAVMGNAFAGPGILDVYDLRADCRHPRKVSSTPTALLGHESGWAPDGRTLYISGSGGQTFAAIDLTDPAHPERVFQQYGVNYHGLRLSGDGRTMYVANIGNDLSGATLPGEGLRILDVSEIQDREPDPAVHVLSNLTWPEGSIPQVAQPFTRDGHDYLLEVDEFSRVGINDGSLDQARAPVGAARIIAVDDPRHPRVVSNLRLEVQQPGGRKAAMGDPGTSTPLGGYTAHYCSVPYRTDPRIVACSMIASGLRVFDISDLRHPVEIAYFNRPRTPANPLDNRAGATAMSQPAWDVARRSVWYTDGNSGFYVVRLTNGTGRLLAR